MGLGKTPYGALLGIELILQEFTDEEHSLSVFDIQNMLDEQYNIQVSDDVLRDTLLVELQQFQEKSMDTKLPASWGLEIEPHSSSNTNSKREHKKKAYRVSERLLGESDIQLLIDAVAKSPSIGKQRKDLVEALQRLQSIYNRQRLKDQESDALGPVGFISTYERLRQAIDEKKTVQFEYLRYTVIEKNKAVNTGYVEYEPTLSGSKRKRRTIIERCSPYAIQHMDGHYYLLASRKGKSANADKVRVFRLDLISSKTLEIGSTEEYIPLKDEDVPERYFKGAVLPGFGSEKELTNVQLICKSNVLEYVIERFAEFDGFKIYRKGETPKDKYLIEFKAHTDGLFRWAMRFIQDVEVIKPEGVRKKIVNMLENNPYVVVQELKQQKQGAQDFLYDGLDAAQKTLDRTVQVEEQYDELQLKL